ncbi:hypothetical protein E6H23_10490 [Candidatus Bathyarchaeota archaeon]|nr:MAG: hypothetical protein E6H23_10490 [Candidatus Bathyarchaeota archaeon]
MSTETAQGAREPKPLMPETGPKTIQCPICRGTGKLTVAVKPGPTYDKPETEIIGCYKCDGKGTISVES